MFLNRHTGYESGTKSFHNKIMAYVKLPGKFHMELVLILMNVFGFCLDIFWFLVLTIFNEGAYLTFKSIFHKALNLF